MVAAFRFEGHADAQRLQQANGARAGGDDDSRDAMEADIGHDIVARTSVAVARDDLHHALGQKRAAGFEKKRLQGLDQSLRIDCVSVSRNQHASLHGGRKTRKHLAKIIGAEHLAGNALSFPQTTFERCPFGFNVGFPDMHLADRPDQISEMSRAQEFLPAGEGIAMQRAHGIGNCQDARQAACGDPFQQPRQGLGEVRGAYCQWSQWIEEPARYFRKHSRQGDRHGRVGADHAGIAEGSAPGRRQRIEKYDPLSGSRQIECSRETDYTCPDHSH